MVAADQFGQVFLALGIVAVEVDLVDAQVGVGAVGQANGGGGTGDLFHHQGVGQITHIGAAVFFADGDAQYAQITELLPHLQGELVALVHLGGDRRDFLLGEVAHAVTQGDQGFVQAKIEGAVKHDRGSPKR